MASTMQAKDRVSSLYPGVDETMTILPRDWSGSDSHKFLMLTCGNRQLTYTGPGENDEQAASARTKHCIPINCGLYYFEITVIARGISGYMGIGLSSHSVNLLALPGWECQSYGYHGDDGAKYSGCGTGSSYAPTFTTGDVIGCGLDIVSRKIFFTKNGIHLGVAFTGVPVDKVTFYPTVGMRTPGEAVMANFGQDPFAFDISAEKANIKVDIWRRVLAEDTQRSQSSSSTASLNRDSIVEGLIVQYLSRSGYCGAAERLLSNMKKYSTSKSHRVASVRGRYNTAWETVLLPSQFAAFLKAAFLSGDVLGAIKLVRNSYPGVLENRKDVLFYLKCRQFVENLLQWKRDGDCQRANKSVKVPQCPNRESKSKNATVEGDRDGFGEDDDDDEKVFKISLNGRMERVQCSVQNGFSNGVHKDELTPDEADECSTSTDSENDEENANCDVSHVPRVVPAANMQTVLDVGREISVLLPEAEKTVGPGASDLLKNVAHDVFALLAYADPSSSPVAYLTDVAERHRVYSVVCAAVVDHIDTGGRRSTRCSLELTLAEYVNTVDTLRVSCLCPEYGFLAEDDLTKPSRAALTEQMRRSTSGESRRTIGTTKECSPTEMLAFLMSVMYL